MKVDVKSPNIIETTYIKYALPVFQKPILIVFYNIRHNHLYSGFTQHEKMSLFCTVQANTCTTMDRRDMKYQNPCVKEVKTNA